MIIIRTASLALSCMVACVGVLVSSAVEAADVDLAGVQGVQEMVLSVADIDESVTMYRTIAGWVVYSDGPVSQARLLHWGLSPQQSARQIVLGNPNYSTGLLRLVQFDAGTAPEIRSSARPFDTGGIFNFNLLVRDLDASFLTMRKHGFVGFADPSSYTIFGSRYAGAMLTGPDGAVINLLSRLDRGYEDQPKFDSVSHVVNATQVVDDYEGHIKFYRDQLGFSVRWEAEPNWEANGNNNFSLPNSLVAGGEIRQRAISFALSDEYRGGTLEVLHFDGIKGRDFTARAHPPNRGVLMYGIHQRDLAGYRQKVAQEGVKVLPTIDETLAEFVMPPYGRVRAFRVAAPGGAWLQFFEQVGKD